MALNWPLFSPAYGGILHLLDRPAVMQAFSEWRVIRPQSRMLVNNAHIVQRRSSLEEAVHRRVALIAVFDTP